MSGRDFEKSIQEKANELRLNPSPELWERVESQIRERRKKRGFAWFMMAAAIVAGSILFWLLSPIEPNQHKEVEQISSTGTPSISKDNSIPMEEKQSLKADAGQEQLTLPVPAGNLPSYDPEIKQEIKQEINQENIRENDREDQNNHHKENLAEIRLARKAKNPVSQGISGGGKKTATFLPGKSTNSHRKNNIFQETKPVEVAQNANEINGSGSREIQPRLVLFTQASQPVIAINSSGKTTGDSKLSDSLPAASPQLPKKNNWSLSILAGGGMSALQNGLFPGNKSSSNELQTSISLPPANVTGGGMQRSPSDVKAGPAFHIGFSLNRAVGKKTSLAAGIQYAYQTNRIRIGQPIDSAAILLNERQQAFAVGNAYTGTGNQGTVYHNAYHYVQLPVEFSWNIDNRKKIFWNSGASLGYLLGSDALYYNSTAGVYYEDKSRINQWMAAAHTSLFYRFQSGGKWQISAGPFVQYQLSRQFKPGNGDRQLYTGVGLQLHLNNKVKN